MGQDFKNINQNKIIREGTNQTRQMKLKKTVEEQVCFEKEIGTKEITVSRDAFDECT